MNDFEILKESSKFKKLDDAITFDKALASIARHKEILHIPKIIDLLDDSCPHYEVMYGLIHYIETFDKEEYVKEILININKKNISKSLFWFDTIVNRIMNDPEYYDVFKKNISLTDSDSLKKLFSYMKEESPHHKELIESLERDL